MLLDQIREKAGGGLDKLRLYSAVVTKKDRTLDLCFAFPEKLTEEQEELIKDVCVRSVGGKFTVNVRFIKDYFDKDTLKSSALNYIRQEFLFFSSKIDENGILSLIVNDSELPYQCPLIEEQIELNPEFVKATYTCWKHLIRDPLIYDLVREDSICRDGGLEL